MYFYNNAIEDFTTVKMAPPLDWNPNGNYVFDDSIFYLRQGSNNLHVRKKRGGAGVKSDVNPDDVRLKFNSATANTPRSDGKYNCI